MEAAAEGYTECVKILLEAGTDIHLVDEFGSNAMRAASNRDIVRLFVEHGADLNDVDDVMRAKLAELPRDQRIRVSQEEYLATKYRRFGESNPEKMNCLFWNSMITSGLNAWTVKKHFDDNKEFKREEIFCFERFGKSINELPDGRIIEIAGEHEDHYDPNFCIYNDVIVHHGDGTFDILGYPREVFRPTDFHTATLVGKSIYIIGNLGYPSERRFGSTQVYRLDLNNFAMEEVQTSGDNPGWISHHKATLQGIEEIHIRGGKVCLGSDGEKDYVDNPFEYVLNLETKLWRKIIEQNK
jgi:hypothetical protein